MIKFYSSFARILELHFPNQGRNGSANYRNRMHRKGCYNGREEWNKTIEKEKRERPVVERLFAAGADCRYPSLHTTAHLANTLKLTVLMRPPASAGNGRSQRELPATGER